MSYIFDFNNYIIETKGIIPLSVITLLLTVSPVGKITIDFEYEYLHRLILPQPVRKQVEHFPLWKQLLAEARFASG